MGLKDMLNRWDQANPKGEITVTSEIIDAAFGNPEVMALFMPNETDALADAQKMLQGEFGGEQPRTVDMQQIAAKMEFLGMSEPQKEALKKAIREVSLT